MAAAELGFQRFNDEAVEDDLVEWLRENPVLWDSAHRDFRLAKKKESMWTYICMRPICACMILNCFLMRPLFILQIFFLHNQVDKITAFQTAEVLAERHILAAADPHVTRRKAVTGPQHARNLLA